MLSELVYKPFGDALTTALGKDLKGRWEEKLYSVYTDKSWLATRKIGNKDEYVALVEAWVFNARMEKIANKFQSLSSEVERLGAERASRDTEIAELKEDFTARLTSLQEQLSKQEEKHAAELRNLREELLASAPVCKKPREHAPDTSKQVPVHMASKEDGAIREVLVECPGACKDDISMWEVSNGFAVRIKGSDFPPRAPFVQKFSFDDEKDGLYEVRPDESSLDNGILRVILKRREPLHFAVSSPKSHPSPLLAKQVEDVESTRFEGSQSGTSDGFEKV
eukprot:TRINITY_DN100842_c0_g1_i1.p1 TRINITY_DN100842_c0_g1~~TRINITY_DN100842_c0_g1_i1.p1  ORF type:complete len:280 (+),score=71.35 TRINITY_DN100842_c0_g1_i1:113-952(+)